MHMERNKKVIILSGGFSEEKEVSKITSSEISKALLTEGLDVIVFDPADFKSYSDMLREIKELDPLVVFNGLHGAEGEDGRLQSLLSMENIHFTGSGYRASAIAMDKYISTQLVESIGIPIPPHVILDGRSETTIESIIDQLGLPLVVKPNDSGSSVGISIVEDKATLEDAITKAFNYSNKVLCEKFIAGRELTVTILGDDPLPVVEIKPQEGWYDYTNKYTAGNTVYEVPAKLSEEERTTIQDYAYKVFHLFECEDYARIDFRYDSDKFYFLEVNSLPGMTPLSLTPMAAREAGLNFNELLIRIIELALEKHR